jgi:DNA polymerase I-like protein with 3'-5' exonuclease and polymerase domains
VLFSDPPVRPAVESFTSTATGTHGWVNVQCLAGGSAVAGVRSSWVDQPVTVDIESFGLDRYSARLKCVSFADTSDQPTAFVLDPRDDIQRQAIVFVIWSAPRLVFHNSAFDVPNLARNGLIGPDQCAKIEDTLIHARLAEPDALTSKNLAATGHRYLGTSTEDHLLQAFKLAGLTKEQGYYQFDIDRYLYLLGSASDAIMTSRLLGRVRDAAYDRLTTGHPFTENGVSGGAAWELVERVQQFNRILLRRACKGLCIDAEFLDQYQERTARELSEAEKSLVDLHIRPGNANDLMSYLDREDALPEEYPRTAKTKKPSTVAAHLETLGHPVAKIYVRYKQISKIQNDYLQKAVDQAGDDGRIYPSANVLAAVTGRASYSGTPIHQFPEDARGVVLADPGDALTSIDWSQIEPVLVANIAGDVEPLMAYESGEADFYQAIGEQANVSRPTAKVVLLAQLYGEGLKKLATDLGIPQTIEEATAFGWDGVTAEELRLTIFDALPRTADLVRPASAAKPGQREGLLRRIARDYGVVFTLSGRIVPVPMGRGWLDEETGKVGPPSRAVHKGVNFFVQGGAFDVLMDTVIRGDKAGLADTLYLTMHDEVVTSTSAAEEWEQIMRQPPERLIQLAKRVPVLRTDRADMGERWAKV